MSAFAHDPTRGFHEQTIFWAPEALSSVIPIRQVAAPSADSGTRSLRMDLTSAELRQASDGWHAVMQIGDVEHRLWLREAPTIGAAYAAELTFDDDFDARAHASHRFWRALNGRAPGAPLHQLSAQRRQRLALALRALDGRMNGATYREIADVLFGTKRIPERAWKTHDLRNRTIRLVQTGFALMRGGYRTLLRAPRRKR